MPSISEIDKNFKVETKIEKVGMKFHDVLSAPFKIHGVFYDDGKFRRIPCETARSVSPGVYALHANTAGGRVRFVTDSPYVAINAAMSNINKMSHFTLCGSGGFDLYADNEYVGTYIPPYCMTEGYEGIIEFKTRKLREITINFPLYSDTNSLYIGLDENAYLSEPTPYEVEVPIVYYGSSITQGGCASRPGTAYQSIVSREVNADFINLGFSGGARAESNIIDYIKSLPMSVFVFDYDHNAPSVEFLAATHERAFLDVRRANPELPIVMMSMPKYPLTSVEKARLRVIKTTYNNALANGDKNVYLIDGRALMKRANGDGTVDGCHPNDIGFFCMAKALIPLLKKILNH